MFGLVAVPNYRAGKQHGWGSFKGGSNQQAYTGQWDQHRHHGWGRCVSGSGDIYEGKFNEGRQEGLGWLVQTNGIVNAGQ